MNKHLFIIMNFDTNVSDERLPYKRPPRQNVRGAGAIILAKRSGRLLFPFRSTRYFRPKEWNLWGGTVRTDESPEQSVIRNAKEQSGYSKAFSDVIQIYTFTAERTNFRYYNYILMVDDEFVPKISSELVTDYIWVNYGELPEPINPMVKELFVRAGNKIEKIIERIAIKESLSKNTSNTIKLKELIKELWQF